jgi:putative transposase
LAGKLRSGRLAVETHENWLAAHRYLNMNDLKEQKKIQLRQAA